MPYERAPETQRALDSLAEGVKQRKTQEEIERLKKKGFTEDQVNMVSKFVSSGLDFPLAVIAVQQMGFRAPASAAGPRTPWEKYEQDHPIMANSKKLLYSTPIPDAASAFAGGLDMHAAEKLSAANMLKQYIQSEDMNRAHQSRKGYLWMMARMPGAPLAGVPPYMGPALEAAPQILPTPAATPADATAQNRNFAAQDNLAYAKKYGL